ncbi:MAG: hybrid sensor histidine kinase/response regulator [Chlamydiota bacterium]|nr:hybrid sensor histidine kinase/response regulator [Chlamydiota bacterium]
MSLDKERFISVFIAEAEANLTALNQGLVNLEKNPHDSQTLSELFRIAHTLKGTSKMMGYLSIRDVAHKIENLFDLIRSQEIDFKTEMADIIFSALDMIKQALENISIGKEENIEIKNICQSLDALLEGKVYREPGQHSPKDDDKKKLIETLHHKESGMTQPEKKKAELSKENADELKVQQVPDTPSVQKEEYIQVPLSRINHILNLIGEMVISKVRSSYRMSLLKRLSKQSLSAEKMLYELENYLKETIDLPDELISHKGAVLRSTQEMDNVTMLINQLYKVQSSFTRLREEMVQLSDEVNTEIFYLNPVIEELQQKMKEIRMLPCATIFEGFPRLVRDIRKEQKKDVELIIHGQETELDKNVLDAIKGPLVHILRNAVDHGIETMEERIALNKPTPAQITLEALQESGRVVIIVKDDGKGIDLDKIKEVAIKKKLCSQEDLDKMGDEEIINFVFAEGFSTSEMITDVSGRGVGLDVVLTEIQRLKGYVKIESQKGQGTVLRLELPLTIAIMQVLLVMVNGVRWAFPIASLEESIKITDDEIGTIENHMIIQVRGHSVPIVPLKEVLGLQGESDIETLGSDALGLDSFAETKPQSAKKSNERTVVIVNAMNKRIGFLVDRVIGEDEVFIKNIGPYLGKVKGVSGSTILANGAVVIILDARDLITLTQLGHPAMKSSVKITKQMAKKKVLIVEDSLTTRELEKSILDNAGYDVETAIDGLDALGKIARMSFDVIISDIQMPRMDGFEFCKNVRMNEKYKEIPFVFVTALSKDEEKKKGIQVGAQAYILKSQFDQGNLLDTIERLL